MIIKKKVDSWSKALWPVFNIIFIAGMQLGLLLLISTPAYIQLLVSNMEMPISKVDTLFPRALVGIVLIEALADHQQWSLYSHLYWLMWTLTFIREGFQTAKAKYRATAKVPPGYEQGDLERGFVVSGLFSLCRHPNFACEQAFWVVLYQWSCFNTDQLYNWTGMGALSLVFLFQGSTWLTEKVTAEKYPEYKEYQKRVSKFIPRMSHALPGDPVEEPSFGPPTRSKTAAKKGDKGQKGSKRN
jgi:steroid 5-alpha reductase family enzyme